MEIFTATLNDNFVGTFTESQLSDVLESDEITTNDFYSYVLEVMDKFHKDLFQKFNIELTLNNFINNSALICVNGMWSLIFKGKFKDITIIMKPFNSSPLY